MAAAEVQSAMPMAEEVVARKNRTFKKFNYRGLDLESLLDASNEELADLLSSRERRRLTRGMGNSERGFVQKLRDAKRNANPGEKPEAVRTHFRDMIILPEMIGSVVAVFNGKTFTQVEIKPEMVGFKIGEFSITYAPVKHGRPGIGGTRSSRFIPLK